MKSTAILLAALLSAAPALSTPWVDIPAKVAAAPAAPQALATSRTLKVGDFGAIAGDGLPDDAAIARAVAEAKDGDTVALLPKGTYTQGGVLYITKAGIRLDLAGSTLHATNPERNAIRANANRVTIVGSGGKLTTVTTTRKSTPNHHRVTTYWEDTEGKHAVDGFRIYGVTIEGSSAAGILLFDCRDCTVQRNTVRRTLADGIHTTGASRNVLVEWNTVRETGDDMIAVVSYCCGAPVDTVTIRNNDVAANYHGRGITVVGGNGVDIYDNKIRRVPAAAILISRDATYRTSGVSGVRIARNTIDQISTQQPTYNPTGKPLALDKGHAAIELSAGLSSSEAARREELSIRNVMVAKSNVVTNSKNGRFRAWGSSGSVTDIAFEQ